MLGQTSKMANEPCENSANIHLKCETYEDKDECLGETADNQLNTKPDDSSTPNPTTSLSPNPGEPTDLTHLLKAYRSAKNIHQKTMIISALSPRRYPTETIMDIFKCDKYMVSQARKLRKQAGFTKVENLK